MGLFETLLYAFPSVSVHIYNFILISVCIYILKKKGINHSLEITIFYYLKKNTIF